MNEVVPFPTTYIPPKQDSGRVGQHRFVLTYQPDARNVARRWLWRVFFAVELQYHGYAPTMQGARSAAQRRIEELMADAGS